MKILAIETSTERGSVALLDGSTAVARADLPTRERHSAGIVPLLDGLLGASGWTLRDLEAVGAGLGPGSFTGIRVGLTVARGLAFSLGIPLKGVSSFEALARGAGGEGRVAVFSDARRGRIYGALYEWRGAVLSALRPPFCLPLDEAVRLARSARLLTPQRERLRSVLGADVASEESWPDAFWVGRIAWERLLADPRDESSSALPLYLSAFGVR